MNTSDHTVNNEHFIVIPDRAQFDSLNKISDEFIDQSPNEVYETMVSSPLGRLLSIISSLPEIRQEKVSTVRRQIDTGQYNINDNLDLALDRVLEEFIAD